MIVKSQHLNQSLFGASLEAIPTRKGFGDGLLAAGNTNHRVVALCADLTESTQMKAFADAHPDRFFEVGIAEQNLVTVASGLAATGKVAFTSSYAAFSPGRNWEQIRTTVALNNQPVKIIGSHAGVSVGPDGATHQMLEDIAMMRALPNMAVIVPCDTHEAQKATEAMVGYSHPVYLRLAREKTAVVTSQQTPFKIGKAEVYYEGEDVTIVACGPLLYEAMLAARELAKHNIRAEVINSATVKPLDSKTILASAHKTGAVVTVEEAQIAGGLGGAVCELLAAEYPVPVRRIGVQDRFGQSGTVSELWDEYELNAPHIVLAAKAVIERKAL